jgi:hypothetical protein
MPTDSVECMTVAGICMSPWQVSRLIKSLQPGLGMREERKSKPRAEMARVVMYTGSEQSLKSTNSTIPGAIHVYREEARLISGAGVCPVQSSIHSRRRFIWFWVAIAFIMTHTSCYICRWFDTQLRYGSTNGLPVSFGLVGWPPQVGIF